MALQAWVGSSKHSFGHAGKIALLLRLTEICQDAHVGGRCFGVPEPGALCLAPIR
ncbi:hypothetical protein Kisp01_28100 [Kineosporia sp. NBRC 101677]|nr:hypothetical protein Kisp01_28100 [Kineosporia sp. NBRC 101677]